jgi:hypothetical protein
MAVTMGVIVAIPLTPPPVPRRPCPAARGLAGMSDPPATFERRYKRTRQTAETVFDWMCEGPGRLTPLGRPDPVPGVVAGSASPGTVPHGREDAMVNAVTSAQVRTPVRTRTADRGSAERAPAERGPGNGRPSPGGQPRRRMAPSAMALLESARSGLAEAVDETSPAGRYVAAHLAALRAAAAVVAVRGEPSSGSRRRRPRSVWELLPQVEPTLVEWAAFFAAGASKRAAAEAGLSRAATAREADDLLRDAEIFLSVVETALGVPGQSPLPLRTAG